MTLLPPKVFLSLFHRFERAVNDRPDGESDNKKPGIVTSYNMPSLLNVPAAMRKYGPLVNLWEGKNMGEGILHFVKSELKIGLRPGWQKRLLLRLLRGKALGSIMSSLGVADGRDNGDSDDDEEEEDNGVERGVYHRYKRMATLFGRMAARKPLSLVRLECGQFGAVLCARDSSTPDGLLEMNPMEDGAFEHAGLRYWKWKAGSERELEPAKVRSSVLLLPYLLSDRGADVFAAVNTTWGEMNLVGAFVVPRPLGPAANSA